MKYHFLVMGCGGTGGNFLKEFARFLHSDGAGNNRVQVTVLDGDVVEKKNIARQPFTEEDVGMNKAEAFCQAIYEVYGLSFHSYSRYVENVWELKRICADGSIPVLIGAVDNHAARKIMHDFFETSDSCIYFDSANEFSGGELVIGARLNRCEVYPDRAYYFPEILKDTSKSRSQMGCEELNRVAPQHIATNVFAASLLLANATLLLMEQKINGGIYYFETFKGLSWFQAYGDFKEITDERDLFA